MHSVRKPISFSSVQLGAVYHVGRADNNDRCDFLNEMLEDKELVWLRVDESV
jgi:hypothetical protein